MSDLASIMVGAAHTHLFVFARPADAPPFCSSSPPSGLGTARGAEAG
jgi:hypothetical protein